MTIEDDLSDLEDIVSLSLQNNDEKRSSNLERLAGRLNISEDYTSSLTKSRVKTKDRADRPR